MRPSVVLVTLLVLACEREPAAFSADAGARAVASGPSPGELVVASVVASVRTRELRIGAPAWELQPFAFGRKLFVRLTADGVEAYSLPEGKPLIDYPLEAPRGTVEIAGGSVLVISSGVTLRIDPGAKEPVRLPPVPFLPGTVLVPDRRDSSGLWSVHVAGRVLARHLFDISSKRTIRGVVPLADYDGGPVTALRDGSLLYRAEDGMRRSLVGGRARPLKASLVPWRVLPGRRVDQAWAIAATGEVELWQITDRVTTVARYTLGAAPYDVAASSEHLAVVVVEEGTGAPRRFRLVVLSEKGEVVMREDLGVEVPAEGERWAALAGQNRHVALSESEPLVAVGGPGEVRVLSIPSGAKVLSR